MATQQDIAPPEINIPFFYQYEARAIEFTIKYPSTGTALDLTGDEIIFRVEDLRENASSAEAAVQVTLASGDKSFTTPNNTLIITADNVDNFTTIVRQNSGYILWNDTKKIVLARGAFPVVKNFATFAP